MLHYEEKDLKGFFMRRITFFTKTTAAKGIVIIAFVASTFPSQASAASIDLAGNTYAAPIRIESEEKLSFLTSSFQRSSSDRKILSKVVREMEPVLTRFLTNFDINALTSSVVKLERKYKARKLDIDYNISRDAKLFLVVKISNKRHCYQGTGNNRIKLVKSKRCA